VPGSSGTLGNANLSLTASAANPQRIGTIGVSSGKWYYEVTLTSLPASSDPIIGFTDINNTSAVSQYVGQASSSYAIYTISTNSFLQKLNNKKLSGLIEKSSNQVRFSYYLREGGLIEPVILLELYSPSTYAVTLVLLATNTK